MPSRAPSSAVAASTGSTCPLPGPSWTISQEPHKQQSRELPGTRISCTCGQASSVGNRSVTLSFSCINPTNPTLLFAFPISRPFCDVRLALGDPTFRPRTRHLVNCSVGFADRCRIFVLNPTSCARQKAHYLGSCTSVSGLSGSVEHRGHPYAPFTPIHELPRETV